MTAAQNCWRADRVEIATMLGRVHRRAWTHPEAPGLAVTLAAGTTRKGKDRWVITHISSGRVLESSAFRKRHQLPPNFPLETAKRIALALAPLTVWSQTADAVFTNADAEFVRRLEAAFLSALGRAKRRSVG